jgi:hypothetical protein
VGVDDLVRGHALRPRLEDGVEMEDGNVVYVKECGVCGAGASWIGYSLCCCRSAFPHGTSLDCEYRVYQSALGGVS